MTRLSIAEGYVDDVLSGRVTVGRWVRLACERHRRDLADGGERGLHFDERAARLVVAFFGVVRHGKGEWAGKPIRLEPWQQMILWILFGWKRADGRRRFRTGYVEVPRKNGKTLLAAGIGCYLLVADGEAGAEIYSAATTREQARLSHGDAVRMVRQSPELGRELGIFKDNLHCLRTFSKFEPLSADYNSLDGLNVHGAICDELHAWRSRELWDVLETATGARRQPLLLAITTAGGERVGVCWQWHDYVEKILSGVVADDSVFGVIYGLDEGDDWRDERNWWKANPNLGVSKDVDNMREMAKRAGEIPAQLNAFLTKHLNVWTRGTSRWMSPESWQRNGHVPAGLDLGGVRAIDRPGLVQGHFERVLTGRLAFGGLDLSSNTDITAWVLVFPGAGDEPVWILPRFFIPADNIEERVRHDRVPYDVWLRQGVVFATPGNVVDMEFVMAQIFRDAERFKIREVAFDRWGAMQIQTKLMEHGGDKWLVQFGQGFASMSPPMKFLEGLVLGGKLGHGGNPVLGWMMDNVVAVNDPAGNIKPDKQRSREKIDGVVALIMALDRMSRHGFGRESVYAKRGLRVL